jgi:hypothetical protein
MGLSSDMHRDINYQQTSSDLIAQSDDFVTLADLLIPLWRARWLIVFCTLLGGAIGLGWTVLAAQYESQGFYQFGGPIPVVDHERILKDNKKLTTAEMEQIMAPGVALADFKRFAASFATAERFNEYIDDRKLAAEPGVPALQRKFTSRAGIADSIEPIYPFTRSDAKLLAEQPKGSNNKVIGLLVKHRSDSPVVAHQMVDLLGRYAMDSILYLVYSDAMMFKSDEIRARLIQIESEIIEQKAQLERYRRTGEELARIVAQHPDSANQSARQVVEITEESSRFLPPATLLTTTKVRAAEANEAIVQAGLDYRQQELFLEYYERVKAMLSETRSGEAVLRSLEAIKTDVFQNKDLKDEVAKSVYNRITVDNQNALNVYLNRSRFIAGPTSPQRSTARPALALAVGVGLGMILSFFVVFGRHWWRANRQSLA